jgi:hypothetical protein
MSGIVRGIVKVDPHIFYTDESFYENKILLQIQK